MTNRRTSNYTAHFATPAEADAFAAALPVPVTDHGHTGITFRAADDAWAALIASRTNGGFRTYQLTTGLGVHRREVQA